MSLKLGRWMQNNSSYINTDLLVNEFDEEFICYTSYPVVYVCKLDQQVLGMGFKLYLTLISSLL